MTTRKPGGPRPRVLAAPRSGFVVPPPIAREAASAAYGSGLPDEAWQAIVDAFDEYGQRLDVLDGPRINENPNDPRSYPRRLASHRAGLGAAFETVGKLRGEAEMRAGMLRAASAADARVRAALPEACTTRSELTHELEVAAKTLVRLLQTATIAQASPPLVIAFNEADARKRLARRIVAALDAGGLDTRLTDDRAAAVADGDMSPVERLLCALEVPPGGSRPDTADPDTVARWADAAARWIRSAK